MKVTLVIAITGLWAIAFADWLEPGWLKFGIPASIEQPFTTEATYDLQCMARRSARQAVVSAIEATIPDKLEIWNWDWNPFDDQSPEAKNDCINQGGEE